MAQFKGKVHLLNGIEESNDEKAKGNKVMSLSDSIQRKYVFL